MIGRKRDADTRLNIQANLADLKRRFQRAQELARHELSLLPIHVSKKNRKLIPTEPGDGVVFTDSPLQTKSDLLPDGVAGPMPNRVVYLFESVQVHEHQSKRFSLGRFGCGKFFDPFVQQITVRKIGQLIVSSCVTNPFMGALIGSADFGISKLPFDCRGETLEITLHHVVVSAGFIAFTAKSSPMVPETSRNGMSKPLSWRAQSAAKPLKCGMA